MIGMDMSQSMTASLGQASATLDQVRKVFEQAERSYKAGAFRKAIILFERVRHMPGLKRPQALLYNIGLANLRLKRFATAVIYFENYLRTPGLSANDKAKAQARLSEAKKGAGIV